MFSSLLYLTLVTYTEGGNFKCSLKWIMDHEENLSSEVIDLNFDLNEFRKYGKIPLFSSNSIILS